MSQLCLPLMKLASFLRPSSFKGIFGVSSVNVRRNLDWLSVVESTPVLTLQKRRRMEKQLGCWISLSGTGITAGHGCDVLNNNVFLGV